MLKVGQEIVFFARARDTQVGKGPRTGTKVLVSDPAHAREFLSGTRVNSEE